MAVVLKGDQSAERHRVSLRSAEEEEGGEETRYKCVGSQAPVTFRTADLEGAGNARLQERVSICARLSLSVRTCIHV